MSKSNKKKQQQAKQHGAANSDNHSNSQQEQQQHSGELDQRTAQILELLKQQNFREQLEMQTRNAAGGGARAHTAQHMLGAVDTSGDKKSHAFWDTQVCCCYTNVHLMSFIDFYVCDEAWS